MNTWQIQYDTITDAEMTRMVAGIQFQSDGGAGQPTVLMGFVIVRLANSMSPVTGAASKLS